MTSKPQRIANRQRKDRDRQAQRRADMKAEGKPSTHTTRSAIAAGIRSALGQAVAQRHVPNEVRAFLDATGAAAVDVLVGQKGFDRRSAFEAVQAQIRPRPADRRRADDI